MATRPILDRVKQALFDRLGARWGLPGEIPPIDVLDLYAGAGGLGIEALSRGARFCCFVESDREALKCLRANLAHVHDKSAYTVLSAPAESAVVPVPPGGGYGLIFLDPPYPLSRDVSERTPLGRVLTRLARELPLGDDCLMVWRVPREIVPAIALPGGWITDQRHDYGTMSILFLHRPAA